MRLHLVSDLHLDHAPWLCPAVEADLTVIAGDVATWGKRRLTEALIDQLTKQRPVLMVLGNHDFWGSSREETRRWMLDLQSKNSRFHFLDDTWVDIAGVRFYGSPLWTDFNLTGDPALAIQCCGMLPDFVHQRDAAPQKYQRWHRDALKGLRLAASGHARVVAITHWVPSPQAINLQYKGNLLNSYFTSDCDHLMGGPLKAWLFGHTHCSYQGEVSGTRLYCNPRGYPGEPTSFAPALTIEV